MCKNKGNFIRHVGKRSNIEWDGIDVPQVAQKDEAQVERTTRVITHTPAPQPNRSTQVVEVPEYDEEEGLVIVRR